MHSLAAASASPPSRPARSCCRFHVHEVVFDRLRVVRLLGRGGAGEVYQVVDLQRRHSIAVKVLRGTAVAGAGELVRELELGSRVRHRSLCRVHHLVGRTTGRDVGLCMELLPGQTLAERLRRHVSEDQARNWVGQVAGALEALHEAGVAHLDLKPANLLLAPSASHERVVLVDFGSARAFAGEHALPAGTGSRRYLAPELRLGAPASPRSDVYSLGRLLLDFEPRRRWGGEAGRRWELAGRRSVEERPRDRFASARELFAALEP